MFDPCFVKAGVQSRTSVWYHSCTGPPATPYDGGLFVFDIHLPHDYPAAPPLVFYRSQLKERLNPNLYVDGKVCARNACNRCEERSGVVANIVRSAATEE